MYPKNSASPPRIAVGAIYTIATGAAVVADAAVVVRPEGGDEAAGTGTLVVGATSGIWYYTPLQAETNYTAFTVTVYKADCTKASVTVVTSASATPGTVDLAAIGGSSDAATRLRLSTLSIVPGTVSNTNTVPSATVFAASDITEATADHFIGRVVIFTSGALLYQAALITDYALDTGEGKFTVNEMTEAPADGDTFIIV